MAKYSAPYTRTMDTTNAIGAIWAQTAGLRRFRVLDIVFGCDGTPGDTPMVLRVNRSTAVATGGTTLAPAAVDSADGTASCTGMHGTVSNGTNSGTLLELACNQRSTVRWFAAPGEELVAPAVNASGFHFLTPVAPTLSGRCCILIDE